jgi:hypothetical protein
MNRQAVTLRVSIGLLLLVAGCGATASKTTITRTVATHVTPLYPGPSLGAAPPRNAASVKVSASPRERRLMAAHTDASPSDLSGAPASTQGWQELQIGSWRYKVPPDHKWATTGATPNGIDITSTDSAHFAIVFATNEVASYTVDQVAALVLQYEQQNAGIAQYQVTATEGPFAGPAGTQEEILSWSGTLRDGSGVTGDVQVEVSPVAWNSYALDGPSASWSTDLPILLAIKANCVYLPNAQLNTRLPRG